MQMHSSCTSPHLCSHTRTLCSTILFFYTACVMKIGRNVLSRENLYFHCPLITTPPPFLLFTATAAYLPREPSQKRNKSQSNFMSSFELNLVKTEMPQGQISIHLQSRNIFLLGSRIKNEQEGIVMVLKRIYLINTHTL